MRYAPVPPPYLEEFRTTVQAAAESMTPVIILEGLADPHVLPLNLQEYTKTLGVRLLVEQAVTEKVRQNNGDLGTWTFAEGSYGADNYQENTSVTEQPFSTHELQIAQDINRHLQASDKPIVALDFGGGLGFSWMRIAARPPFNAAIAQKKLIMAVTNLGSTPDQTPDAAGYTGIARVLNSGIREISYSNADLDWFENNQKRVQFIMANALELHNTTVSLSDGDPIPLLGNTDIIHERASLMHTHTPDLALACFDKLLGDRGMFYSDAAIYYHSMHRSRFQQIELQNGEMVELDRTYNDQRRLGLAIGSRMLTQQGFDYTVHQKLHQGVFRKGLVD